MFGQAFDRYVGTTFAIVTVLASPDTACSGVSWELGAKLGPHFGKMTGDATSDFTVRVEDGLISGVEDLTSGNLDKGFSAFSGGGYVHARLSDRFGVRLEALFTRKGGTADVEGVVELSDTTSVAFNGDITLSLDYVEFPLLAVVSFPTDLGVVLEAVAGPSLGFNSRAESKLALRASQSVPDSEVPPDFDFSPSATETLDGVIKSTDLAGVVGTSLIYPVDAFNLHLDLRWTLSLTSIDDSAASGDLKNKGFSLSVGWSFPLAAGS